MYKGAYSFLTNFITSSPALLFISLNSLILHYNAYSFIHSSISSSIYLLACFPYFLISLSIHSVQRLLVMWLFPSLVLLSILYSFPPFSSLPIVPFISSLYPVFNESIFLSIILFVPIFPTLPTPLACLLIVSLQQKRTQFKTMLGMELPFGLAYRYNGQLIKELKNSLVSNNGSRITELLHPANYSLTWLIVVNCEVLFHITTVY